MLHIMKNNSILIFNSCSKQLLWGIMNLGHFWKSSFFTKTPIPLTKFHNFEKIQISRNHEKLDGYCKLTLVFVSSKGETSKTSTKRDSFQKNSIFKISWKWNYLQNEEILRLLTRKCYIFCSTIHYYEELW
jgi:hypothetical protein